jgi:23S rRNA U2552 (ribose-2'-O)-methylase RlmE/FtsJ
MQSLSLYELPQIDDKILKRIKKSAIDTQYSRFYNQPQMENGFNVYIHRTKDKMSFVNEPKFKGKNFYHVTNPFEHTIVDKGERTDIATSSKLYFDIGKDTLNISSRAFYKLWEMLLVFNPMNSTGPIVTAHLAEAPGSFVQAVMFYREKFYKAKDYDKDEHFTISLDDVDVPAFKKDFKKAYKKVKIYEQDGGDLTDTKSITKFQKFSKKADFITADGGFEWINENYQEQEAYRLILGEIITALKIQKDGGTFIIKLFEIYTNITIKILAILSSLYDKTYMFKPFTSRPSNSERYMICKGYKGSDNTIINKLETLLEDMNVHHKAGLEISELLVDYTIPINYHRAHNNAAIRLSHTQFLTINKILTYVNSNDYYGDQYHQYLKKQQNANDYWVQTFYPVDNLDLKAVQRSLLTVFKESIEKTQIELNNYVVDLI